MVKVTVLYFNKSVVLCLPDEIGCVQAECPLTVVFKYIATANYILLNGVLS